MKHKNLSKKKLGDVKLNEDVFRGINLQKALRSFLKDHSDNLKFITGEAKKIVEDLSNPANRIYADAEILMRTIIFAVSVDLL